MAYALIWQGGLPNAVAHEDGTDDGGPDKNPPKLKPCRVITADRLFDGYELHTGWGVLVKRNKVARTGSTREIKKLCSRGLHLGNATLLPGFIESHAHITFQGVGRHKVLAHGVTTVQDTGGPLLPPTGGEGALRLLSVGPIIQAPGGYPLNVFGGDGGLDQVGYPVATANEAQNLVQQLVDGGATAIKVALESGGEPGAPWMMPHGDHGTPAWSPDHHWPILSQNITSAIVAKAHSLDRRVIVHVGENTGFERALNAGVDEFAHIPCAAISPTLLQQAANTPGLTFVSTIDTLSSCVSGGMGIHSNTAQLSTNIDLCEAATPGQCARIVYGSEIGHDNVPWGINGEEMRMILHLTSGDAIDFSDVLTVFRAATSKAGERLGIPLLGTLTPEAPADLIAVKGNPFERFKLLEYPDLVISGGRIIVNHFK
ncbi:MAG: amidohydrolase family protein [Gammaproteobacteria bacterium]